MNTPHTQESGVKAEEELQRHRLNNLTPKEGRKLIGRSKAAKRNKVALVSACKAALSAFRYMYDRIEDGASSDELHEDPALWPLETLRNALLCNGVSSAEVAEL